MGCWNTNSWNNKDQEIIERNRSKMGICALSEDKIKGKGIIKYENYILIYSRKETDERVKAGMDLLLHENYAQNIISII